MHYPNVWCIHALVNQTYTRTSHLLFLRRPFWFVLFLGTCSRCILPFSIIFAKCSEHVAVYLDICVVQVDIEHNLLGDEKVVAPVADTKWALVELKIAACPRQDPIEDPFTRVNVTHRASQTHWRPQSKTERDVVSNSTLLVKTKLSSPVLENRDIRVMASVTGAKRRQLTETAVRYSKVAMAVLHLLH